MLDGTSYSASPAAPASALSILAGEPPARRPEFLVTVADARTRRDHLRLRHREFVQRQKLFPRSDLDEFDADPQTITFVAVAPDGVVLGGVRLVSHRDPATGADIGWWSGSRLAVVDTRHARGIGAALVRAACAHVESAGALRFDATVQDRHVALFRHLGWDDTGPGPVVSGRAHRRMRWPVGLVRRAVEATKAPLGTLLTPFLRQPDGLGPKGFRGDDGAPVPGTDVIAACDAILPSMVERDPEWAGWCSVLVNVNDLTAMGARPVGLLDAVAAPTAGQLDRIVRGLARAADAWDVPVLGGHTQLGVPAALAVTALGTTPAPVRAGGGKAGDRVSLIADLGGQWRPGYRDRQWDSTSRRSGGELRGMAEVIARLRPAAAKDVSMAGLAGTLGMLAEASGTGAELDIAAIPRPSGASMGAWLGCFPGFAMIVADPEPVHTVPAPLTATPCGRLTAEPGVRFRWPDGTITVALDSGVTGLGAA